MRTRKYSDIFCHIRPSFQLSSLRRRFRCLCSRIGWLIRKRPRPKVFIKRLGKLSLWKLGRLSGGATKMGKAHLNVNASEKPVRIATFNVAMFALAPAISKADKEEEEEEEEEEEDYVGFTSPMKSPNYGLRSILKQSPRGTYNSPLEDLSKHNKFTRPKLKVTINLPDNEISVASRKLLDDQNCRVPVRSPVCFPYSNGRGEERLSSRSILQVLREVDADVLALQDVKAEEGSGMKPLSDLAGSLKMNYVFAESWAPEYGNAILSKWPIKTWKVQKIADDRDFRNVLKATIDVPWAGELNFQCTQLDHLNENWRMKQINAIIRSNGSPHILAGGLNSLNGLDYSSQRWSDIVKYYEGIGKPTPKVEVMKFLKAKEYIDAKEFSGECEPVVIIAKDQNVQGTCKYGTRVDYILASQNSPYKFVPGSYSVVSSKGTSDHHIVKVDMVKVKKTTEICQESVMRQMSKPKQKAVEIVNSTCYSSRGVW